jgi:serpin B
MRALFLIASMVMSVATAVAQPQEANITAKQLDLGVSLLKAGEGSNRTISPYSIHSALMLLRLGAKGETAAEFDRKLLPASFSPVSRAAYQSMNSAIFASKEGVTTVLGNSLWLRTDYAFTPKYLAESKTIFSAEPHHIDYGKAEDARATINSWVSSKTKDLIPQLLPQGVINAETTCTLVNTLYFKSAWLEPFKKELTKDESFWTDPSNEIKVPMMHRTDEMGYFESSEWRGVHLSYESFDYTFVVIAPNKKMSATELARSLSPSVFSQAMEEQKFERVSLAMPRFKVRQSRELFSQLGSYGLTRLASGDFSGISPKGIGGVGSVMHEAVVAVDENGTEAAAATAVIMFKGAFIRDDSLPKEVRLDRPFAFALIHKPTKAPLFLGVVADPR